MPTDLRIQHKLSSLCHNCPNSTAPDYLTELLRIYKPTRQLRSSSDTSILCIPTVRTHTRLVKGHFLLLRRQSGTLSLTKSGHSTPSHPSNHHLKLSFFSSPTDCVRGEREREKGRGEGREKGRERGRERERERERTSGQSQSVCVLFFFITYFV